MILLFKKHKKMILIKCTHTLHKNLCSLLKILLTFERQHEHDLICVGTSYCLTFLFQSTLDL